MTQADHIIKRFGSMAALARALARTPSVVQGWKISGHIPAWHHQAILEVGALLSPPLDRRELVEDLSGTPHDGFATVPVPAPSENADLSG